MKATETYLEFGQSLGGHQVHFPPHLLRVAVLGGLDDDVLLALQGSPDVFDQKRLQHEGQVQADLRQLLAVLFGHFDALCGRGEALLTVKHLEERRIFMSNTLVKISKKDAILKMAFLTRSSGIFLIMEDIHEEN